LYSFIGENNYTKLFDKYLQKYIICQKFVKK